MLLEMVPIHRDFVVFYFINSVAISGKFLERNG